MVGAVPCEAQTRRRLPPWMLGPIVNNDTDINNPDENETRKPKPPRPKSMKAPKEPSLETDSCGPATRGTRRRKRNLSPSLSGDCDSEKNDDVGRALVKVSAPRKTRKQKSLTIESSEEIDILSPTDGDGELTVEDLMSIAKEYIETGKDTDQQKLLGRKQETQSHLSATSFSEDRLDGSLNVPKHSSTSPMPNETSFVPNLPEKSTKQGFTSNPGTGDSTQDMLDLFLGPLLRKPLEEEKKAESITQDLTFSCELEKQSQNDIIGEELIPLTKKKTTLKDKVAFFLD